MDIYKHKDYTYNTTKLLFDKPCIIDRLGEIYPVKVTQYDDFMKYANLLVFSRKYLGLKDNISLLSGAVLTNAYSKCKDVNNLIELSLNILNSLDDMCKLIEMVTHKKIIYIKENDIKYTFKDIEGEHVLINEDNFDIFREVILKMNLLKEPKVFEDKLYEKMYYRAIKANRKEGVSTEDMILTIVQDMKYDLEYVSKLNMYQLNALFLRIVHVKNSDAITIYRTCSDKLPNISYTDGVVNNLFKENDDSDLFADLGGVSDKLS